LSKLSRLEISLIAAGLSGVLIGVVTILSTFFFLYELLPNSKYMMTSAIAIGIFMCYLGIKSLRFRERETGLLITEFDIKE
jgi:uncharacterized BrkB/YihY/UPF0761 family membrane protein